MSQPGWGRGTEATFSGWGVSTEPVSSLRRGSSSLAHTDGEICPSCFLCGATARSSFARTKGLLETRALYEHHPTLTSTRQVGLQWGQPGSRQSHA